MLLHRLVRAQYGHILAPFAKIHSAWASAEKIHCHDATLATQYPA